MNRSQNATPIPQSIQHTIAVYQVLQMLLAVEGEDARAAVLRRAGILPALLESPLARVTQTQFARLMTTLVRHHRDEFWGLSTTALPLGSFAMGCRMLVGHRKLGDALRAGLRYYHALLVDFVPRLQVSGGVAYLRMGSRHTLAARQVYAVRVFMFFSYGVMCWLAARRIPVDDVVYQGSDVARRSDASKLFQAPIRLMEGKWGYRFDAKWLDLPVVQSHESVETFLVMPRAWFNMSFLKVGLVPDVGALYTLPRVVGVQRAKEIMLSARDIDAHEAVRLGIAMELHEPDQLLPRAQALSRSFVGASPAAVASIKRNLNNALGGGLQDMLSAEAQAQSLAAGTAEHREAVGRFLNKQAPFFAWPVRKD